RNRGADQSSSRESVATVLSRAATAVRCARGFSTPRNGWQNFLWAGIGKADNFDFAQTMKITEILLAEHVVFHNLFDHVERTAPRLKTLAEIKSLAVTLETLLFAHSKTEDDLFVAPLEHCLEQIGQRDTFHEEHDEID